MKKHPDTSLPQHPPIDELFTEKPTVVHCLLVILILLAALYAQAVHAAGPHILWYDRPARLWTEALPIGNGRLGGMVYGNVATERIQLNEETIWAGRPNNNANPEAAESERQSRVCLPGPDA